MDKYLIEILKQFNTIIIPDLGALTIVNAVTNEVMFMPYLKYDDGKLAQYIAEKEGWSENDAKNLIAKYVREINTKLDQGESYDMYNFGSFYKNEEGDIEFKTWEFDPLKEAIDTPPVIEIPEEENTQNNPEKEVPESIKVPAEEIIEEKVDSSSVEHVEEVEDSIHEPIETIIEEKIEEVAEIVADIKSAMVSEEEQWADDLDVPPVNYQKEVKKQPILEKTSKDKKRKKKNKKEAEKHGNGGVYAFFIISALVIAGAIYLQMNREKFFGKTPIAKHEVNDHQEHEASPINQDNEQEMDHSAVTEENIQENLTEETQSETVPEVIEEDIVKEKPVVKEQPKVTQPIVSSNGITIDKSLPVQVIVGSFGEEANAESKVASLKASGFDAAVIGRYNGLHFVSIGSFNSMTEFNQNKSSIEAISDNYWVFKK